MELVYFKSVYDIVIRKIRLILTDFYQKRIYFSWKNADAKWQMFKHQACSWVCVRYAQGLVPRALPKGTERIASPENADP